ncbi:MAG: ABC transporter ATP-binding protein/permease [Eubacteriaceae bacterium]|nr:ABC transporter ATP-binding protein/permease [Eubacteriaceae bacterium]
MSKMTALVAAGIDEEGFEQIKSLALGLLFIYLARVVCRFLSSFMSHKAAWHLVEEIRLKVYGTLQSLSMDFYRNHQSGDLVSRTISDTATFENLFAHLLPDSFTNVVTLIGVTTILFSINARLALLTCVPIPFILLLSWFFAAKVRPNFRVMQKSQGDLSAQLQDNYSGIQEIQAFGQQEPAREKVREKASVFTGAMLNALRLSAVFHPGIEFFTALGTVIVVGFGGYLAYIGQLNVSDIVAFMLYLALFYAPITGIANLLEGIQHALAGAERVIEVLDTPVGIEDRPGAKPLKEIKGALSFENVDFSYIDNVPVLKDISFDVKPGQMVALVGATGVGKTTIAQLIARFYDPVNGSIQIDGHDIRDIQLSSLRSNIAMVLQDTFLFNGTIAENIAFAKPGSSQESIEMAAKIARVHDDIEEMPDMYETKVGERGMRLSGGQKQRIAIARAVLCKAPLLILDEATASVDVQTEADIQRAIADLTGSRTIVVIAHRLSTVKKADLILVFEDGSIVQRGTHKELSSMPGLYRDMCEVQESGSRIA